MKIVSKTMDPKVRVLQLSGRFTMGADSLEVEPLMDQCLAKNDRRFVFDLTQVEFIDSSGLGILVNCLRKAQQSGGELRVVAAPRVEGIIKVVRLDRVLPLYATVAAACECFPDNDEHAPAGVS